MAREGTDIFGQRMPVYFDTWLYGGQSSLATYLAAAFIRLFGNQIWIARLPLALTAFASLFALKGWCDCCSPDSTRYKIPSFC